MSPEKNTLKTPKQAINKAFFKIKLCRADANLFKQNLALLLANMDKSESEEFHKNLLSDFLKKTFYDKKHFINTKERCDLVIHHENTADSHVAVIFEIKTLTNKEMVSQEKLNTKALQELVYYYLRERINANNLELKHLIITNVLDWFIFDASLFERLFIQNKRFIKKFHEFETKQLVGNTTDFCYKEIIKPYIDEIKNELEYTYFNLAEYAQRIEQNEYNIIPLFKVLSPEHLLKQSFINDSNTLDRNFYDELLYIMGLEEIAEGSKKFITRLKPKQRHSGSLLELTITQLETVGKLARLKDIERFGANTEEQLFNIALELTITWINRILFLKLLEAQLLNYHKNNPDYAFLNIEKIVNLNGLNSLFFDVLAKKIEERKAHFKSSFGKIPYLNSSLFEATELEDNIFFISCLNTEELSFFKHTILKDTQGKKITGSLITLDYLLKFLDAYDFSSEGVAGIQEQSKTLISASVLGLIFEKINGYQDGAFFTPGFITMYMCRETIRQAIVQKFNTIKNWQCTSIADLSEQIDSSKEARIEANRIIDDLKICDTAVGSGHFLVSALNEIIAVKSDLKILLDAQGKRLKEYTIQIINDELVIIDDEGDFFQYRPHWQEGQQVQQALFHEKQKIIENCLFGVDINPNSVKICRLRLWIELLKHAYYKTPTELETLPNIDINIKTGNSLISRFPIDVDLSQILSKKQRTIEDYQIAVATYKNVEDKIQKRAIGKLIDDIKTDFSIEISKNNPKKIKLNRLTSELFQLTNQDSMFQNNEKIEQLSQRVIQLNEECRLLEIEINEVEQNPIFKKAFEWRFEFPEVLNEKGDFIGFDVIIGNPPYGVIYKAAKEYFIEHYESAKTKKGQIKGSLDSYSLFIELGLRLCKANAMLSHIVPMAITSSQSMTALHKLLFKTCETLYLSSYSERPRKIFDNAEQRVSIFIAHKNNLPLAQLFTTKVLKFYGKISYQELMNSLVFVESKAYIQAGRLPKVGDAIEISILEKLKQIKPFLKELMLKEGEAVFYRTTGGRYYRIFTDKSTGSTQEKCFYVNAAYQKLLVAILSSNLYFWFHNIYSDNLHIKSDDLENFPIPLANFNQETIETIELLVENYLADLWRNSKVKQANYETISEYREFYARLSKPLIDKIDYALQKAYGLTDEEVNFIINYDLEFRV